MGESFHLLFHEAAVLRDAAAANLRLEMRQERVLAPEKLERVLEYLDEHLFDPELTVDKALRECGIRSSAPATELARFLGQTPLRYFESRRHKTACRLLSGTTLPISLLSQVLGFSGPHHFEKSFRRVVGELPSVYRQRTCRQPAAREALSQARRETCRQALTGEALSVPAMAIMARLVLRRPAAGLQLTVSEVVQASAEEPAAAAPVVDVRLVEEQRAALEWEELEELPVEVCRERVRQGYRYRTPVLFHLLCQKSRESTRRSIQRALQLAQLSLVSLANLSALADAKLAELQALGHAWIGYLQGLLLELTGAEQSFALAEAYLNRIVPEPLVEARVAYLKGHLRYFQSRFSEAFALSSHALELFRQHGTGDECAKALVLRSTLLWRQDTLEEGIGDLLEARDLITNTCPTYLVCTIHFNLTRYYYEAGKVGEAALYLNTTQVLAKKIPDSYVNLMLRWFEGSIAKDQGFAERAESLLTEAFYGLKELGYPGYAALVGLDLASLFSGQKRITDAIPVAIVVLELFEAFEFYGEAAAALNLLRKAVETQELPLGLVREVRAAFKDLEKSLTFR